MSNARQLPAGRSKNYQRLQFAGALVIHTVGPVWSGGGRDEAEVLASCYRNSLQLAVGNGIKTIAFPAISCGVYRYPISEASQIAVETTWEFLANSDKIDKLIFVVATDEIFAAYRRLLHTRRS